MTAMDIRNTICINGMQLIVTQEKIAIKTTHLMQVSYVNRSAAATARTMATFATTARDIGACNVSQTL
jgi:hypothetical protein